MPFIVVIAFIIGFILGLVIMSVSYELYITLRHETY